MTATATAKTFPSWPYRRRRRHSRSETQGTEPDAIKDCSKRGGLVLDPFLGSGTTIIACERTGRRGAGLELDPRYVDVTINRWEALTCDEARHADTGLTFDELRNQRQGKALLLPPPATPEES